MAFGATYDACVLYPAGLRDLLIRLAQTGLFRARWTDDILDEMVRSILDDRPDLKPEQLDRTRTLMCDAVADCLTTGYESLIDGLDLPDPNDRHVLAAAIRAGSGVIVTENIKDFPTAALEPYNIEAQTPDVFVMHHYFDELSKPMDGPAEPVGEFGLQSYRTIDNLISDALGIERARRRLPARRPRPTRSTWHLRRRETARRSLNFCGQRAPLGHDRGIRSEVIPRDGALRSSGRERRAHRGARSTRCSGRKRCRRRELGTALLHRQRR